ncbi:hypothetical protein PAUR_a0280 [Pseudoalteromonas aurantia 208]|uniref:Uncharacterized protein n=1 Tax=Pseudoalteromonas aurantia 208 TaxID=1314867 RepID=A0ABR9E9H9_9GAMM|nr:hypothetical protein [Pseudoalteromonas aurantia 208]
MNDSINCTAWIGDVANTHEYNNCSTVVFIAVAEVRFLTTWFHKKNMEYVV